MNHTYRIALGFSLLLSATSAAAQINEVGPEACGDLQNHFGPFDYRIATKETRAIVENHHFTPKVEALQAGQSTVVIGGDIAYTLRVFPNHPRALQAMARLSHRERSPKPKGAEHTIDCYFERAMRFQPNDPGPHLLYGIHLLRLDKPKEAIDALNKSLELGGSKANIDYNLGLAHFDLKEFDQAMKHAKAAYEAGWPLPGLKDKLRKAGKWRD